MDGVLNIDKPSGITSHDVIARIRRILRIRQVGHAGTLDPLATGVLVVCVDRATRIVEYLVDAEKEYEGVMTLGVATDTQDSTGEILSEQDASLITAETIAQVLPRFLGVVEQMPPMVSALHHEGRRLYELAREGKTVERKPRRVEIRRLEMLSFNGGARPRAALRVVCSKGLYIRTLFADIGAALGTGAHMSALRRTRVGPFGLETSVDLDKLRSLAEVDKASDLLTPMADALAGLPSVTITPDDREIIRTGRAIATGAVSSCPVRILYGGKLAAIGQSVERDGRIWLQPTKVFV